MVSWQQYKDWLGGLMVTDPQTLEEHAPIPGLINTDTRSIREGEFYLPLVGQNFDGHQFIEEAIKKGATGFFYDTNNKKSINHLHKKATAIEVTDTYKALRSISSGWRLEQNDLTLFALTGSSGKTTVKEMVTRILKSAGECQSSYGNFNNEIGVPLSLLKIEAHHKYAILEFGARNTGDIKYLCETAVPNITCITNVGDAHYGIFSSRENILNTKLEIVFNSPKETVCVVPRDDETIYKKAIKADRKLLTFGAHKDSDIKITDTIWKPDGSMIVESYISNYDKTLQIHLPIAHVSHPINIAASIAMAVASNIDSVHIEQGLNGFSNGHGRYNIFTSKDKIFIDDAYNANPQSVKAGLQSVMQSFSNRDIVVVLGDMLELGPKSSDFHREIGRFCASLSKSLKIITVGNDSKFIYEEAEKNGISWLKHFKNIDSLIENLTEIQTQGDIFYVKGSNGIKLNKLIEKVKNK